MRLRGCSCTKNARFWARVRSTWPDPTRPSTMAVSITMRTFSRTPVVVTRFTPCFWNTLASSAAPAMTAGFSAIDLQGSSREQEAPKAELWCDKPCISFKQSGTA